jgi:RNA polymerase sigma factor (sigma-70 family)
MSRQERHVLGGDIRTKEKSRMLFHESDQRSSSEQILLTSLGREPHEVLASREFRVSINSNDRENWLYLFAISDNVEGVIAASNQGLVRKAVAGVQTAGLTAGEKLQAANAGILRAINDFDPSTKTKFGSSAETLAHAGILRAAEHKVGLKKEERNLNVAYNIMDIFAHEVGREPSSHELRRQLLANTRLSVGEISKVIETVYRRDTHPDPSIDFESKEDQFRTRKIFADLDADREDRIVLRHRRLAVKKAIAGLSDSNHRNLFKLMFEKGIVFSDEAKDMLKEALSELRKSNAIQDLLEQERIVLTSGIEQRSRVWERQNVAAEPLDTEQDINQLIRNSGDVKSTQVRALNNAGISVKKTAEMLGLPVGDVNSHLRQYKKDLLNGLLRLDRVSEWIEKEGMTQEEIAGMLGLNKRMVKECLADYFKKGRLRQDISRYELANAAVDSMTTPVKVMMKIRKKIFEGGARSSKVKASGEIAVFKAK